MSPPAIPVRACCHQGRSTRKYTRGDPESRGSSTSGATSGIHIPRARLNTMRVGYVAPDAFGNGCSGQQIPGVVEDTA
jgi:hypothetical protein